MCQNIAGKSNPVLIPSTRLVIKEPFPKSGVKFLYTCLLFVAEFCVYILRLEAAVVSGDKLVVYVGQ